MMAPDVGPTAAMIALGGWGDRRSFLTWAVGHAEADPLVVERNGAIVATGVGTANGTVGWLGAIVVDRWRRRHGYGRAVTEAICERLEAGGARTLALVASRQGAPLYATLGFVETSRYHTFERAGGADPQVRHADGLDRAERERGLFARRFGRAGDLDAILALDRPASGEDRGHLLRAWAGVDSTLVVADGDSVIHGFVVRPPFGGGATVADSPAAARMLLARRRLIAGPGRQVRAGLPSDNERGRAMLAGEGWNEAWSAPRMERGEAVVWRPDWMFGQFSMALG